MTSQQKIKQVDILYSIYNGKLRNFHPNGRRNQKVFKNLDCTFFDLILQNKAKNKNIIVVVVLLLFYPIIENFRNIYLLY